MDLGKERGGSDVNNILLDLSVMGVGADTMVCLVYIGAIKISNKKNVLI